MKTIRIGNGCGFWGDNLDAPILLAENGKLDYLTLEYLAELTMSILAIQKQRDPKRGYAHDFLKVLERLCPILKAQPNLKIITNAGGMNPLGCAEAARNILDRADLNDHLIGVVAGDDLMPNLDSLVRQGDVLKNLDSDNALSTVRDQLVSANAYLGAMPIVDALRQDSSIVITGRVADASLVVAPAIHEHGWSWDDWDRISAATVAGHLIECGAQVTGGLWCNWTPETNLADVGYPIARVAEDGTVEITKPEGTGGVVNRETVIEQLLYEVGDPTEYLTPDVIADFTSVQIEETAENVVRITGAKGKPATDSYKVSMAYRDGFMSSGQLLIYGPDAMNKAKHCAEMILSRLRRADAEPEQHHVEHLGMGAAAPVVRTVTEIPEVVLRVAVRDSRREVVDRFTREIAPLVTSGPPGIAGYATGRAAVREIFAHWPALIPKRAVYSQIEFI